MKPPIEHIRLSRHAKDQLVRMKRDTGILNWNILCRWAFLLSLTDNKRPRDVDIRTDSNLEMSWKVFSGDYQALLASLFYLRCQRDGITSEQEQTLEFRKHLGRGIGRLCALKIRPDIVHITELAVNQ